jgi:hypothetical protein
MISDNVFVRTLKQICCEPTQEKKERKKIRKREKEKKETCD